MLRIAIDDEIELDAEVPEHELSRLRVGGTARVVLPSGETVPGEIRRIDPDVDPAEKLGRARIALPPHPGLRSGGFARALIAHDERSSPMAPEAALRFSTDGESVLTVDAEGKVKSVRVKTGARSGGRVELIEGPGAGERVIVGGAAFVLEGDAVEAIESDGERHGGQRRRGGRRRVRGRALAMTAHREGISAWAIRHPTPVILLFVALTLAGVLALVSLPTKQLPDISFAVIRVTVVQPGASATELETQVARPVENAVFGIANVDHVRSTVAHGVSVDRGPVRAGRRRQRVARQGAHRGRLDPHGAAGRDRSADGRAPGDRRRADRDLHRRVARSLAGRAVLLRRRHAVAPLHGGQRRLQGRAPGRRRPRDQRGARRGAAGGAGRDRARDQRRAAPLPPRRQRRPHPHRRRGADRARAGSGRDGRGAARLPDSDAPGPHATGRPRARGRRRRRGAPDGAARRPARGRLPGDEDQGGQRGRRRGRRQSGASTRGRGVPRREDRARRLDRRRHAQGAGAPPPWCCSRAWCSPRWWCSCSCATGARR